MTTFDDVFAFLNELGDEYCFFTACRPPDEPTIASTEAQLGFRLPEVYRAFVARYGAVYLEVIEEVWRRPQEFEIRPQWQMCFALWVHGVAEHPGLSLIGQRQPGFLPVLRVAGLGLRDAIGYDDAGRLMRSTEVGLAPAGGTLAGHVLDAARRLVADRERLRSEPIAPAPAAPIAHPSARLAACTVSLQLQASADALPAALRRALDEIGATFQVKVTDSDARTSPAKLEAFATHTDDAHLKAVLDGRELRVAAYTPSTVGGPLQVFIQSLSDPTKDKIAATAMNAFERSLAATGTVVERSISQNAE
jgi:hypothetical protein